MIAGQKWLVFDWPVIAFGPLNCIFDSCPWQPLSFLNKLYLIVRCFSWLLFKNQHLQDVIILWQWPLINFYKWIWKNQVSTPKSYLLLSVTGGHACRRSIRCWNSSHLLLDSNSSRNNEFRFSSFSTSFISHWKKEGSRERELHVFCTFCRGNKNLYN